MNASIGFGYRELALFSASVVGPLRLKPASEDGPTGRGGASVHIVTSRSIHPGVLYRRSLFQPEESTRFPVNLPCFRVRPGRRRPGSLRDSLGCRPVVELAGLPPADRLNASAPGLRRTGRSRRLAGGNARLTTSHGMPSAGRDGFAAALYWLPPNEEATTVGLRRLAAVEDDNSKHFSVTPPAGPLRHHLALLLATNDAAAAGRFGRPRPRLVTFFVRTDGGLVDRPHRVLIPATCSRARRRVTFFRPGRRAWCRSGGLRGVPSARQRAARPVGTRVITAAKPAILRYGMLTAAAALTDASLYPRWRPARTAERCCAGRPAC